MDAKAERRSLNECPLPPVVILNPLSRVWDLDGQIAALEKQIEDLSTQREEAMQYALDNAIEEDEVCKLVVKKSTSQHRGVLMLHITTENRLGIQETTTGKSLRITPEGLFVDGKLWQGRTTQDLILEVREVE